MTKTKRAKPKGEAEWEALFQEYVQSGLALAAFLKSKGINPSSGGAHKGTKGWRQRLELLAVQAGSTAVAGARAIAERKVDVEVMPSDAVPPANEMPVSKPADMKPTPESGWAMIQRWRRNQALEDWKTADAVRQAIRLTLRDALRRKTDPEGKVSIESNLKPHELRQITQALEGIQRVQRLSLGLSTANIGVDGADPDAAGAHIEKEAPDQGEAPVPLFEVQMSSRGRFLRPRPRRVN